MPEASTQATANHANDEAVGQESRSSHKAVHCVAASAGSDLRQHVCLGRPHQRIFPAKFVCLHVLQPAAAEAATEAACRLY